MLTIANNARLLMQDSSKKKKKKKRKKKKYDEDGYEIDEDDEEEDEGGEEDEEDEEDFEEEFFNDEDEDEELNPIRQSERETAKYEIMRVKRNGLNEIRAVVNSPTYSQVLRKMKIKDISSSVRTEVLLEAISHKSKVVL